MSDKQNNLKNKLDLITEELIDNIINTSDAEFLKEMEEDYGNSSVVANEVRDIVKKSQMIANKK